MQTIATLTLNPAIDACYTVDALRPTVKLHGAKGRFEPGGGGINVTRVLARLGVTARAYYCSGGPSGIALDAMLDQHLLVRHALKVGAATRMSVSVVEAASGLQYRIVPEGEALAEQEWRDCLALVARDPSALVVASGSLPPGVPIDFYARLARLTSQRKRRLVLDTSGPALASALSAGGIFLVKPSREELQQALGGKALADHELASAAAAIVAQGKAEIVAVTLGKDGAVLATRDGVTRLPALDVPAQGSVGAGDSFLAAMVHAIACERSLGEAFRAGIAAGAAAVLTAGTSLCQREDLARLLPRVGALAAAQTAASAERVCGV
ncbi:MAG: hexose kinase [Novosphingobium sp.]|nr:hexose kinase [Novosphingobium sp.]